MDPGMFTSRSDRRRDRVRGTVLRFKGDQVRIGIEAPPDVAVDREEIWVRKQREARGDPAPDGSAVPAPNSPLNSR